MVPHRSLKPTLVVSCTDRKSLKSSDDLQLRNLSGKFSLEGAAERWAKRVREATEHTPTMELRDLYKGEYWRTSLEAAEYSNVLVASAGLGLVGLDSVAPGYGATFVAGVPDSILRFDEKSDLSSVRSEWWNAIANKGLGNSAWTKATSGVVLVALSSSYQQALSDDLIRLARAGKRVVVMSGSRQIPSLREIENIHHVETGQWLRMVLGGSTPCVGINFAQHLLQRDSWRSIEEIEDELMQLKGKYSRRDADKLPVFSRAIQTDAEVKSWIEKMLKTSERIAERPSKSAFLRKYRDDGFACEQKRFGTLFEMVSVK